jgi:hypothetical protein
MHVMRDGNNAFNWSFHFCCLFALAFCCLEPAFRDIFFANRTSILGPSCLLFLGGKRVHSKRGIHSGCCSLFFNWPACSRFLRQMRRGVCTRWSCELHMTLQKFLSPFPCCDLFHCCSGSVHYTANLAP